MKILVIDAGGTFIKYAVMNENGEISGRGKVPTPQESSEELVEAIGGIFDTVPEAEGIAISMTGIFDTEAGICMMGGPLAYNTGFHLKEALEKRCHVNISIENDAKCAALAEAAVGSLKDVKDGIVLVFGTMIGGGIIHDHKLLYGKHFSAGEVSYIIPESGIQPGKGHVFGNVCGVPRLCALYAENAGIPADNIDGKAVFEAVDRGEEAAAEALRQYAHDIAVQIFNLQTVYDPERFALGGGISEAEAFLPAVMTELEKLYDACPFRIPRAELTLCEFRNDANLIGALQCYLQRY